MFQTTFSLYATVASCKKLEKFKASASCNTKKTHCRPSFIQNPPVQD